MKPVLLIKMATRGRPTKFLNLFDQYQQKLSGRTTAVFVITCDLNDRKMNSPQIRARLTKTKRTFVYYGKSKGKVEAINADIEKVKGWDVLLVTADDMTPVADGYDAIICNQMRTRFPGLDGVLWFNDGHVGTRLNTLPCMGRKYYERFHYVYHPSYVSLWCDNEFTQVATKLGRQQYIDKVIIRHDHPQNIGQAMDKLGAENEKWYARDHGNFKLRRKNGFPV